MIDWCDTLWYTSQTKHKQMLNEAANARLAAQATTARHATRSSAHNWVSSVFSGIRRALARLNHRQTARVSGSSTGFLF